MKNTRTRGKQLIKNKKLIETGKKKDKKKKGKKKKKKPKGGTKEFSPSLLWRAVSGKLGGDRI